MEVRMCAGVWCKGYNVHTIQHTGHSTEHTKTKATYLTQSEGQGRELGIHLIQELSGRCDLQAILGVNHTAIHGGTGVLLLALALGGGQADVQGINFTRLESALVGLAGVGRGVMHSDVLVAVNDVSLHLMHDRALEWMNSESSTHTLHRFSYVSVSSSRSDHTSSNLGAGVSGVEHVCYGSGHRFSASGTSGVTNDSSVCRDCDVAINMNTHVYFDQVAGNKNLLREGRQDRAGAG